jgi:sulfur carrier protein
MTILVNNQTIEYPESLTIAALLEDQLVQHLKGLAIAVNDVVIPKSDWAKIVFQQNDSITIIRASQGG